MFNIFTKKTTTIKDFSFLRADIHCHVLPGIDDGPADLATALKMLQKYQELGFTKVYATPHINESYFPNTTAAVRASYEKVKAAMADEDIHIELHLAAEYKTDDLFKERLEKKDLLTIEDKYVLIELPFMQAPLDWEDHFFNLQMAGYTPVLAHVERYAYWHGKPDRVLALKDRGIEPQLNLSSLIGRYGPDVKKMANQLIEKEAYLWVGTDAHHPNDLMRLREQLKSKWPRNLQAAQYQRNAEL